jgi:hypothetical protein
MNTIPNAFQKTRSFRYTKGFRHAIFWFGFLIASSPFLQAQNLTFADVDSQTLTAFNAQKWDTVIQIGTKSLNQDIDYLGLRYRIGVAYYVKQEYAQSIPHFKKVLAFDHYNQYALEYLYYAYLFTGNEAEAILLSPYMEAEVQKRVHVSPRKPLDYLYAESGLKISSASETIGNLAYTQVGLGSRLSPKFKMYNALSFVNQNYSGVQISQQQYYLNTSYYLGKGWSVSPALHLLTMAGTASTYNVNQTGMVAQLGITKQLNRLSISPYANYLSLSSTVAGTSNTYTVSQVGGVANLGIGKFNLNADLAAHTQSGTTQLLSKYRVGVSMGKRTYLEGSYFKGNASLFSEDGASIIQNSPATPTQRLALMGTFALGSRFSLYLLGQQENRTDNTLNYTYNTILAGVKIKL